MRFNLVTAQGIANILISSLPFVCIYVVVLKGVWLTKLTELIYLAAIILLFFSYVAYKINEALEYEKATSAR